ncbi:hypothetical protein LOTGIDRAFT_123897 [Lottia gigantea]|uniref:Alpha/beta hydrolase fold-3 domain-containing protein n=1 Tax=Lottia gigantea TaxID=225164 RepID=V4BMB8_LOTGI|nr:hypothetical protein LOTGIDRAFT_123897 [Lottia gigantea]ESO90044.1 hypothetical protein LOTGIDRAFT_123897 [Lottia gigantea]
MKNVHVSTIGYLTKGSHPVVLFVQSQYWTRNSVFFPQISNSEIAGVDVRIFKPQGVTGLVPGFIYLHGGSWSMLDSETYDNPLSNISRELNVVVIGVDYRLAPEFPFPYPYDDCLAVTKFILNNGELYGIDTMRVGIGGDSAGGNLAAAVLYTLRNEQQQPAVKSHVSIYGVLQVCDFTLPIYQTRAKYEKHFKAQALYLTGLYLNLTESQLDLFMYGDFSTPELDTLCKKYVNLNYLPSELLFEGYERGDHVAEEVTEDVRTLSKIVANPLISPLLVEDLSGLPTTLVLSVGWDILGDENQIYAGRLKAAGVKVTSVHMKESFHGCFNLYHIGFRSGVRALNTVKKFLKETL